MTTTAVDVLHSTSHAQVFWRDANRCRDFQKVCDKHGWAGGPQVSQALAESDPCPFCRAEIDAVPGVGRYRMVQMLGRVQDRR